MLHVKPMHAHETSSMDDISEGPLISTEQGLLLHVD
jgi:hypothetical protein